MDELGKVTLKTLSVFGHEFTINPVPIVMTWIVMAILVWVSIFASKRLSIVPSKIQGVFELIYEFLSDITLSTLGEKDGKKYLPFVVTLFIFILFSNWFGIIPNLFRILGSVFVVIHKVFGGDVQVVVNGLTSIKFMVSPDTWYSFLLSGPGIEEPTKSVNTDLALAILVFILCQAYAVKNKGLYRFLRDFADDPFPMKGPLIIFFFLNPFFYLNLIGTVANVVSHSFRLFGNIFGGGMIIVIVSHLLHYFLIPVGLFAFFGLFAGLVQAFVFTMLAVTYLQQQQA